MVVMDSGLAAMRRPGMTPNSFRLTLTTYVRSNSGFREQLVDIFPVHQMIDERLQIIRAAVAIIDVIRVLPDVDAEDRGGAMHQRAFAVGGLGNFELAVLHRQPRPARTKLADAGGGEINLE